MAESKRFVGLYLSDSTRKRFKMACIAHDVNQGDVMELLIEKWLSKPHIESEIKELINGKEKNRV